MSTEHYILTLKTELDTDPLGRGYSGMTDEQITDSLNTADRSRPNRVELSTEEVFAAIDASEFEALTEGKARLVSAVLMQGDVVKIAPGDNGRAFLLAAFGNPSATISALSVVAGQGDQSRWQELGLPNFCRVGYIQRARDS